MSSFLRAVLDGPIRADAFVQRMVNAGMFALMRLGPSKAMIRYVLNGAMTLTVLGLAWMWVSVTGWTPAPVILLALLPVYLWAQRKDLVADEEEETESVIRPRWHGGRFLFWLFLTLDVLRATGSIAPGKDFLSHMDRWRAFVAINIAFDVLVLLLRYSEATPPRPTSRQPRRVLVPEKAK